MRPNEVFISIAGYSPTWFKGYKLPELAPKKQWWTVWHNTFKENLESYESKNWYIEKYKETVLNQIDPIVLKQTFDKLSLTNDGKHHNITLLCYESPDKFCHRHLVAEWINSVMVLEMESRPVVEW